MPILTPNQPKYFNKAAKSRGEGRAEQSSEPRSRYKKNGEKRSNRGFKEPIQNGLCIEGRKLAGGKVPRFRQDATVQLWIHFKECKLCSIPNRPPLNSPEKLLEKKLEKIFKSTNNIKPRKDHNRTFNERVYDSYIRAAAIWKERGNQAKVELALTKAKEVLEEINALEKTTKVLKGVDNSKEMGENKS